MDEIINDMARAGYQTMFDGKWDDLPENSIDRAMWLEVIKAALKAVKFPEELYKICQKLHLRLED
jgi:hypothetical protein